MQNIVPCFCKELYYLISRRGLSLCFVRVVVCCVWCFLRCRLEGCSYVVMFLLCIYIIGVKSRRGRVCHFRKRMSIENVSR